ncbi:FTR1 family protein [Miltoncostaea marina]|uniref:FTR1 family protein n=1 Tax=Miltoncostaea marina TaxID=2843215 RepID=UPI001C3D5C4E|nr:FTR1 family protein [Miltoncostaea marina]
MPTSSPLLRRPGPATRRIAWWSLGLAALAGALLLMATAAAPADPVESAAPQAGGAAVANAAIIVFREGLEAVLIVAAVVASLQGAHLRRRRPVVAGACVAFAASVATWFVVQAALDAASPLGPRLEAITGALAVVVLLVVLNWFVHRVYWSEWIGRHHRRRRELLGRAGLGASLGLVLLGFTSVYREGFEVVLFLQNLELRNGSATVAEGVALGLAGTAVVGALTFWLHRRLPYRRMLVWTGLLVGAVLVVMVGGTALTFQQLGWLPAHPTPFPVPGWMGSWFELYPSWETLAAQAAAAAVVIGSYHLAEYLKVTRPVRRGERPAERAGAPAAGSAGPAGS